MATSHNNSIKSLNPPIILLISLLSQHNLPLITRLLNMFHSGVIRDEILIMVALQNPSDIITHNLPVPKRRFRTVHAD
jgi:hypothetical protein